MRVLVVDVGGTHVKILATGQDAPRQIDSGPTLTAEQMVAGVKTLAAGWTYDAVSIGYPGPVLHGCPVAEPRHPPRPGLGRIRLSDRLRMPGQARQRCRDASAWQLPGRQDALSRAGNGPGLDPDRRRHRGADGVGPPAVPGRNLRGAGRTARTADARAHAMAA